MSLIARFDRNMTVIGRLLKEYRTKKNLSYEKLSAKLELMGICIQFYRICQKHLTYNRISAIIIIA